MEGAAPTPVCRQRYHSQELVFFLFLSGPQPQSLEHIQTGDVQEQAKNALFRPNLNTLQQPDPYRRHRRRKRPEDLELPTLTRNKGLKVDRWS